MIRINLLPFRDVRKKENIRRQVSIFLLSVFFSFILLFYYNIYLSSKLDKINKKVDSMNIELARYNKINKEIADIKRKLNIQEKKMDVISKLEANRAGPVMLLDEMTKMLIPKRMWFTGLESKEKKVKIKGIALDNKTVADFMTQLESSKLFKGVNLEMLKQQKIRNKNINLKQFEIICLRNDVIK